MLTLCFSTRNGERVLPRFLDSLVAAVPPPLGWKLVAVDNASSDDSRQILESYQTRLPITLLHEPAPGKNRALNLALELAEGDLYVFCDDDVVVAPDWLVRWREAADAHPGFDLFAGRSEPLWPHPPAPWVTREIDLGVVFAVHGQIPEGPCEPQAVFGNNMAVRAAAFAGGLRFNPDIGPSAAKAYPMGSETELVQRLVGRGCQSWFVAGARVGHIIREHQLVRPAILLRGYRHGRGRAHLRMKHHYGLARLARKNRVRNALYPWLMPLMPHPEAWARQWEWAIDQGYEDGCLEVAGRKAIWLVAGERPRIAARFSGGEADVAMPSSSCAKAAVITSG